LDRFFTRTTVTFSASLTRDNLRIEGRPVTGTGPEQVSATLNLVLALADVLFSIAANAFTVSGVGIFTRADWWSKARMASALFSSFIIFMLWDGSMRLIVEKGLIGFLISPVIFVGLLLFKQPSPVL